jgi:nucleoside-diphosphate-sugar epimerase
VRVFNGYKLHHYPVYKRKAEQMLQCELPPGKWSIIRPAQVWGNGDKTLTPRIVKFLRHAPCIIHFGKWRGTNRWPLAHVDNVATATLLAATAPEAAGKAINILDNETTSIDAFYRIIADLYLPRKTFQSITLPFWLGYVYGVIVSAISNLLNLDHPFSDPSLYALYSVSHNLDFGNQRMRQMFLNHGKTIKTLEEGVAALKWEKIVDEGECI